MAQLVSLGERSRGSWGRFYAQSGVNILVLGLGR